MPEFLELLPPAQALEFFLSYLKQRLPAESVVLQQALGRVTAEPIYAPHTLPDFPRSTVDGYAVRAADTYGASESLPAYLMVVGEVPMGGCPAFTLGAGQCALIHTGGMLPEKANGVVMVEYTQLARSEEIEILRAVAPGENVLKVGEDVAAGELVIPAGTCLRPADLGGLAALGIAQLQVVRQPRVAILSSGDEVVPVSAEIQSGQVRDVNTYTLSGLVQSSGGIPVAYGILPDRAEALLQAARQAFSECDVVIFTAGSSASTRDLTAQVINDLGEPGVLVHGVNVRPGKPTILGVCAQPGDLPKAVIGLPGNPVSALVIARLFVSPLVQHLLGISTPAFQPTMPARLTTNLASQAGREDWIPVKLVPSADGWLADPIFGKSNLIFSLARADGLVCIPADATGISAGETVAVQLLKL